MRLTTRGRFTVMAMVDIASRQAEGPVSLGTIARRQDLSLSYLEQLFSRLRRHGLVASVRGPGGGYRLGRDMNQISIASIILAVDEPLDATQCGGHENCGRDDQRCSVHDLWTNLNKRIYAYLDSVTLADLVDRKLKLEPGVDPLFKKTETLRNVNAKAERKGV